MTGRKYIMAIVTISRGVFSGGKELAECVAERLGYQCISEEVIAEAASRYDTPYLELSRALSADPGILEGMTLQRSHYLAYIASSLANHAKNERLVYHGHAGHLLLKAIPNILRIKVTASIENRVNAAMEDRGLGREQAVQFILASDNARARWERFLYHVDRSDISIYDFVIDIDRLTLTGACDIVCFVAKREEYRETQTSQKLIDDLILAADVRAKIASEAGARDDEIQVDALDEIITISGSVPTTDDADKIREVARQHPRVKGIISHMGVRWISSQG